jgi:hypothetical protein
MAYRTGIARNTLHSHSGSALVQVTVCFEGLAVEGL